LISSQMTAGHITLVLIITDQRQTSRALILHLHLHTHTHAVSRTSTLMHERASTEWDDGYMG
jgi:hypothetical protein